MTLVLLGHTMMVTITLKSIAIKYTICQHSIANHIDTWVVTILSYLESNQSKYSYFILKAILFVRISQTTIQLFHFINNITLLARRKFYCAHPAHMWLMDSKAANVLLSSRVLQGGEGCIKNSGMWLNIFRLCNPCLHDLFPLVSYITSVPGFMLLSI